MNLAWKCLSFSNSSRSFSMGGRMVILKRTNSKPGAQAHSWGVGESQHYTRSHRK